MPRYGLRLPQLALMVAFLGTWALGQKNFDSSVDGALSRMDGSQRDLTAVANHFLAIEMELVDVLAAAAKKFDLRFDLPKDPKPSDLLASHSDGRNAKETARSAFSALKEKLDAIRSATEGRQKLDKAAVQKLCVDALLLSWAIKGHLILETIGFKNGGTVEDTTGPDGEPDQIIVGALGRLLRYRHHVRLLNNALDTWAENAGGLADRKQQMIALGIGYPNASNPLKW